LLIKAICDTIYTIIAKEGIGTDYLDVMQWICRVLIGLIGLLYAYRTIFLVVGIFKTRKFPEAKQKHKYAVVIAARNEEKVIGLLIDSIHKQEYPKDKITIFVVADNCSDKTAEIARAYGAVCYERQDHDHCTKGFALQYLFQYIEADYGIDAFEGYFVFDADNLLKRDFVARMNDAFDAGEKIITSYRNTKNFDTNALTSSYGLHWLRTARLESCGRSVFGFSTRLQGTGYLISAELLRDGWNHTSLTEDREFSTVAAIQGVRISYQHEAQFYDEQASHLKVVWRQRTRWAKGNLYAFLHFFGQLMKGAVHHTSWRDKLICLDMQLTNAPYCMIMIPLKLAAAVLLAADMGLNFVWWEMAFDILNILIFEHLGVIPMAMVLFVTERKRMQRMKWYQKLLFAITFPLFGIIGDAATWVASVTKVTWKPIPHGAQVKIEELEVQIA